MLVKLVGRTKSRHWLSIFLSPYINRRNAKEPQTFRNLLPFVGKGSNPTEVDHLFQRKFLKPISFNLQRNPFGHANQSFPVLGFSGKPEVCSTADNPLQLDGGIFRYRCFSVDQETDMLGGIAGTFGQFGLFPAVFFKKIEYCVARRRDPVWRECRYSFSHDSHL